MGFRQQIGLMAQGYQRSLDASKRVVPISTPHPKLLVGPEALLKVLRVNVTLSG